MQMSAVRLTSLSPASGRAPQAHRALGPRKMLKLHVLGNIDQSSKSQVVRMLARGVRSPFPGPERAPKLVSCTAILARWAPRRCARRRVFPRAGGLRAVRWSNVELEHGTVHLPTAFAPSTRRRAGIATTQMHPHGGGRPRMPWRRLPAAAGRAPREARRSTAGCRRSTARNPAAYSTLTERDTGFEPATSSLGSWHSTN